MPKFLNILRVSAVVFLFSTSYAYAYVDPGSGSVIVTTVLGLIAAIGYTFRKYYYKAKNSVFKRNKNDNNEAS